VTAQPSGPRRRGPSVPHFKEIAWKTPAESRSSDLKGVRHLCGGNIGRKESGGWLGKSLGRAESFSYCV